MKKRVLGILFCLLLALPAWYLGKVFPVIGGSIIAIVLGIVLGVVIPELTTKQWFGSFSLSPGIAYTSKKLLQYSVILLGFEMNLQHVIAVGSRSLAIMAVTLAAAFVTAYLVSKLLHVKPKTATLISVGTAICGGSAIAATAPVISAQDDEVASSISTIFLFNIIAVFIFPLLGRSLGLTDEAFGIWAGTAVNDTSSVVAAASSWSAMAGNDVALATATIVKLTRTLMIIPISLVLAVYTARKERRQAAGQSVNISRIFPWFVLGFVLASVIKTFLPVPEIVTSTLSKLGKFMIVMAMAAIGLNTNIKALLGNGFRPVLLGFCCWAAVCTASLAIQLF